MQSRNVIVSDNICVATAFEQYPIHTSVVGLVSPTGEKGSDGVPGRQGMKGVQGEKGNPAMDGEKGEKGTTLLVAVVYICMFPLSVDYRNN